MYKASPFLDRVSRLPFVNFTTGPTSPGRKNDALFPKGIQGCTAAENGGATVVPSATHSLFSNARSQPAASSSPSFTLAELKVLEVVNLEN